MRVIEQDLWRDEVLNGTVTSDAYDVGRCYAGSFQISWGTSSQGGIVKLQASLDKQIWTDIPNASCDFTTSPDSVLWNLGDVHYPWIRVSFRAFSDTTVTGCVFMKGGG